MPETWPSSLPQAGLVGISGGPQNNVVSFQPEIGPSIDRRRVSMVNKTYKVELPPLDQTQYEAFITFFETTLTDGILSFSMTDAFTQTTKTYKFKQNDPPYNEELIRQGLIKISFEVIRLN